MFHYFLIHFNNFEALSEAGGPWGRHEKRHVIQSEIVKVHRIYLKHSLIVGLIHRKPYYFFQGVLPGLLELYGLPVFTPWGNKSRKTAYHSSGNKENPSYLLKTHFKKQRISLGFHDNFFMGCYQAFEMTGGVSERSKPWGR